VERTATRRRGRDQRSRLQRRNAFIEFDEVIATIGHDGDDFLTTHESPQHRALVPRFSLANRLITNGEYLEFMEAGGYTRPDFWLSLGWTTINDPAAADGRAPLYWGRTRWGVVEFHALRFFVASTNPSRSRMSVISRRTRTRLGRREIATEFEWERAAAPMPIAGNSSTTNAFHPTPAAGI